MARERVLGVNARGVMRGEIRMGTAVSPPARTMDSPNVAVPLACDRAQERDEQQRCDDDGHRRGDDDDDSRVLHGGRVVRRLGEKLQRRGVDDVVQRVAGVHVFENGLRELHSRVRWNTKGSDVPTNISLLPSHTSHLLTLS